MPALNPETPFAREVLRYHPSAARLWVAWRAPRLAARDGAIEGEIELRAFGEAAQPPGEDSPARTLAFRLSAHGPEMLRVRFGATAENGDSPMLVRAPELAPLRLVEDAAGGWQARDEAGRVRARFPGPRQPPEVWSRLLPPPPEILEATFLPDGERAFVLSAADHFFPGEYNALPLGQVSSLAGDVARTTVAFAVDANECFSGTGERFAKMDLAGRTVRLWNEDALGVNNRRAYKNVPFVYCSRGAGVFFHTSAETVLSLADVSTRSLIGAVEDAGLEVFLIGGGSPERVLRQYRALTGVPAEPPRWSYGVWMAKMTYFSEAEVKEVARRLRAEDFPCDVLHLDTGWFDKDWVCEWQFSAERFPDPRRFFADMRRDGFRVSLWQNINLGPGNRLLPEAMAEGHVPPLLESGAAAASGSDFSAPEDVRQVDFTHPPAEEWYRGKIGELLDLGAAAIKTDFGETIRMDADYRSIPAKRLRNLYALLYQRAAFEETVKRTGEGLVWARAGWAGCQRFPVHWGGDCAATWDGMAASLRGGLHLGLSGFAHWSHDVPGFHGVPDFMNSRPSDDLVVRWTQFGVFTSHLRYHGTNEREPYAYPAVAPLVRAWLRLRYALIPYLEAAAEEATRTGYPLLRAMIFEAPHDPVCHHLDDQYLLGSAFLVAPVMNARGRRDVYLPAGRWVDFWTGEAREGPCWIGARDWPLARLPLWVRAGARVPCYPTAVRCTEEMDGGRVAMLCFDEHYRGFAGSVLAPLVELPPA